MKEKEFHYIFTVGRMPEKSARIIQNAYRRYKLKLKLARIKNTYEIYLLMKEEENYLDLKRKIRNLCCKWVVKATKIQVNKTRKLKLIREKLALMSLKKIFRQKNWKIALIIEKIKRYKRRRRAAIKRKLRKKQELLIQQFGEAADLSALKNLNFDDISINSEEDFETTTSDREAIEKARLLKELEEERRVKIYLGKISYNCYDIQVPKFLTLLHQRDVPLSASQSPMLLHLHSPVSLPRKTKARHKSKKKRNGEPSYMKATMSFNIGYGEVTTEELQENPKVIKRAKRDISTLMLPTKASVFKIKERSSSVQKNYERDTFLYSPDASRWIVDRPQFPVKKIKHISQNNFSNILPDISTRHSFLPLKVKPRASIMRGFAKQRMKKSDLNSSQEARLWLSPNLYQNS